MRKTNAMKVIIMAAILSINDGLNSNFALVMGAAASGATNNQVILTGLLGLLAGAVSMGLGEWTAASSVSGSGSPIKAALSAFASFAIGSFIPIFPFFFLTGTNAAIVSAICSANALFTVGVIDAGRKPAIISGLKQVLCGAIAAAFTYGLGYLFGIQITG